MRVHRKLTLLISENDDGSLCKFNDDGEITLTTTAAGFAAAGGSNTLLVDNSDGDVDVPFGSLGTVHVLFLRASRRINVKINGGSEEIPVEQVNVAGEAVVYIEGVFTAIQINNPDAVNQASVLYAIAGVE